MVFTETWLHKDIPDSLVDIEGFSLIRADRNDLSGKTRGGGTAIYVNTNWCKSFTVREITCCTDLELLCVSLRPLYLPREFGNVIVCAVYVPPSGNASKAAVRIADCVHQQLQRSPGAPVLILGDMNHCKLEPSLPGFVQYINCNTRNNRILDKCYGNIKDAYVARSKPPLANSDHNTIHLIPTYKSMLKRSKPQTKTVTVWSENSVEELRGCFLCTDWDIFHDPDIDINTEVINCYIHFCVDNILTKKTITMYPNNKPYISKELKDCINKKKAAFRNNDRIGLKKNPKRTKLATEKGKKTSEGHC